jgi:hypothetical protein
MGETFIVLTAEQADRVRGRTSPWTALDPVALTDGKTFALPGRVLRDPAHQSKWSELQKMSLRMVALEEWPTVEWTQT